MIKTLRILLILISLVTLNAVNYSVRGVASAPVYAASTTNFGIGVSALPDSSGLYGWMPNSNIPWTYAYQYLTGGVNTGQGWETWGPNGTFALQYAEGANSHNYIPVFSYYELHQSNGNCNGCSESQKDLANLNNVDTMKSYFQNFTLLMKTLGNQTYNGVSGYGKTAIVHIEPDLSGFAMQAVLQNSTCYGYCTAQGNNPSYLRSAVASTGDPDIASFPNTYTGFNLALLHIRDLYAPNVLLAAHVSDWQSGTDIGSSHDPSLDVTSLGDMVGTFTNQLGAQSSQTSSYDYIFNDVLDRDAGYYQNVLGNSSYWWDRDNTTFPNFHRWEQYIGAIHATTGKSIIVWQIPEGNQYFDTENNTDGHYQDNRAEYFFSHIDELENVGIVGLLFGSGNAGSTNNFDQKNDGITNSQSSCSNNGASTETICNNHNSTFSDDDGGYIRLAAAAFYAGNHQYIPQQYISIPKITSSNAAAPTITTPQPTPTIQTAAPQLAFKTVSSTISASFANQPASITSTLQDTGNAAGNILIDMEVYNAQNMKVYQQYFANQSFSAGATKPYSITWNPPTAGSYTLAIGVFSNDWKINYEWDTNSLPITIQNPSNPSQPVSIHIWWPTNGSAVDGTQPFQARIDSLPLSSYTMYWKVNNGQLNEMHDSPLNCKESDVNLSEWDWSWNNVYPITFVAKDATGKIIASQTTSITVNN